MGMPSCEAMPSRTRATLGCFRPAGSSPRPARSRHRDSPCTRRSRRCRRNAAAVRRPNRTAASLAWRFRIQAPVRARPHHGAVVPDLSSIRVERRVHGVGGRDPPESPSGGAWHRLVAGPSIHMLAVGPEVAVVVVGRIRAGLQRAQRQLLLQGAGQGGNSAAMSLPGSPRLSWLIQSSNHGARLAHAPEQAGHARTACRSRYGSDRRRRRTGGRARAACRVGVRQSAQQSAEKARTPGRRPRRHTGSTPRIGAHAPARRAGNADAHLPGRNRPRSS